jgi:hypothetical protein
MTDELPDEVDPRLWVTLSGAKGTAFPGRGGQRAYLTYNPHTFLGLIGAWFPGLRMFLRVAKRDIAELSPEAEVWMAGFLAGNEPEPQEMFGPGITEAADDDPRVQRWRQALAEFRRTGWWPHASWVDVVPFPPGTHLPQFVWVRRGDEIWAWDGTCWAKANPQPALTSGRLSGSVCSQRGRCDVSQVTTVHLVCTDCGETMLVIPEGFTEETWREHEVRAV